MRAESLALALFPYHALELFLQLRGQRHVPQSAFRVRSGQKSGKIAARLGQRDRTRPPRFAVRARPCFRPVDELTQLLGEVSVTVARGLCGNLHGDRIEPRFVPLRMGSNQRLNLVSLGHGHSRKRLSVDGSHTMGGCHMGDPGSSGLMERGPSMRTADNVHGSALFGGLSSRRLDEVEWEPTKTAG